MAFHLRAFSPQSLVYSRLFLGLTVLLIPAVSACAQQTAPLVGGLLTPADTAKNGTFTIGGIGFSVQHKSQVWAQALQRDLVVDPAYPQVTTNSQLVKGRFKTDSGTYDFTQQIKSVDPQSLAYSASLQGTPTKESRFLCLSAQLPVNDYRGQSIFLDDQAVAIPWWGQGQALIKAVRPIKQIRIPLKDGQTLSIEGYFTVNFQDNRDFNSPYFDLQIYFTPYSGAISEASLNLNIQRLAATSPQAVAYNPEAKRPPRAKSAKAEVQNFTADSAIIAASLAKIRPLSKLTTRGENLVDDKGQRVRLWGMNLVSFYPDYALADKTADNLAALGINLARPHHNLRQSNDWSPAGYASLVTYQADSRTPNLKAWDRYDYLNARLREKGIYLALSVHSSRMYHPDDVAIKKVSSEDDEAWADAMDELNRWNWKKSIDSRKMLPVFDERAFLINAEYARYMLNHVNPYTGIAYGKDSQVVSLELINEFSSEYIIVCGNKFPDYWTEKLNALLKKSAMEHNVAPFTIYAAKTPEQKKFLSKFCHDLDDSYAKRMEAVIRETGYSGPILTSNLWRGDAQLRERAKTDGIIEDHAYDDPFVVGEPSRFLYTGTKSALADKPVIIGEFNQSEDPKIIKERKPVLSMLPIAATAYSSLQNIAGITWFAWAHGPFSLGADGWGKPGVDGTIGTLAASPDILSHLRACGIIYKNGYLDSSSDPQTIYIDDAFNPTNYDELMRGQSPVQPGWQLVHSFRKAFGPVPAAQQNANWAKAAPPSPTYSDTDQIVRDVQRQQLSFAAAKTEGFSGYLDGKAVAKLGVLAPQGNSGFASSVAVTLDDVPLRQSRRILLSRTYTDAGGKSSSDLPIVMKGLTKGNWVLKVTRPAAETAGTIALKSAADGTLTLPTTTWSECEINLQ